MERKGSRKPVPVIDSPRLPLVARGALLARRKGGVRQFVRRFRFRTRGVWYVWLKARCLVAEPAMIRYLLDEKQPLKYPRRTVLVSPGTGMSWHSFTGDHDFRAQVHVGSPGVHTLTFEVMAGEAEIERVAATLYYSARPTKDGRTLDHSRDPGGGKAEFPGSHRSGDGFRNGSASPPVRARRRFYVDFRGGDDRNDGRAPKRAWKMLARVNRARFRPGDAVLFRRGREWNGGLAPRGSGTEAAPITAGSYGSGARPRIHSLGEPGFALHGQSWWRVQDLELNGSPLLNQPGFLAEADGRGARPRGLFLTNIVAINNGGQGIVVSSGKTGGRGYDGVVVDNCLACWNRKDGIVIGGLSRDGSRNAVIRRSTVYGNQGMGGMWINSTTNGLIERCVAYNNPVVNIWTWDALNVTIRECESYRAYHLREAADADGYDIDWGSSACTIDRCYSHHNEIMGYLIMGAGYRKYEGFPSSNHYNLLRRSVAEDEMQGISMAASYEEGLVYGNTILAAGKGADALRVWGWSGGGWPRANEVAGNVFMARRGARAMSVDLDAVVAGNRFAGNLYAALPGAAGLIRWAKQSPFKGRPAAGLTRDFRDIRGFRRHTGQERGGVSTNPRLRAPGSGGLGRLPLSVYRPRPGTPLAKMAAPSPLTGEWLAARRKLLVDTGAEKWGIPMEPGPDRYYSGRKVRGKSIPGAFP